MEYGVYVQHTSNNSMIMVCLYVDDIFLGNVTYFLGMEIMYYDKGIIMHQPKYELELLKIFELMSCKSTITPAETNHKLDSDVESVAVDAIIFKQLAGSLRYLCNTRPDICYAVGMMSKFMNKQKWSHYQVVVKILRYIKGTLRCIVCLSSCVSSELAAGFEDQGEQACEADD
ncbi:uncharacterized mitochondrial protein AtMg00810-like [Lathyrus oleraceus]|uniref:uncharacterized mitochondrial protein AtMg00810-like n=1 Tax=Pisum sativum TaxID=3888 RepID=UPI0021D2A105|nr:uncharacterized mitochondrial protein AtMg00810-like [Pisum sativum]